MKTTSLILLTLLTLTATQVWAGSGDIDFNSATIGTQFTVRATAFGSNNVVLAVLGSSGQVLGISCDLGWTTDSADLVLPNASKKVPMDTYKPRSRMAPIYAASSTYIPLSPDATKAICRDLTGNPTYVLQIDGDNSSRQLDIIGAKADR